MTHCIGHGASHDLVTSRSVVGSRTCDSGLRDREVIKSLKAAAWVPIVNPNLLQLSTI